MSTLSSMTSGIQSVMSPRGHQEDIDGRVGAAFNGVDNAPGFLQRMQNIARRYGVGSAITEGLELALAAHGESVRKERSVVTVGGFYGGIDTADIDKKQKLVDDHLATLCRE